MTPPDHDPIANPVTVRPPTTVEDTRIPAGSALKEGDRLGNRYVLQRQIGVGGMSVVWRAWDEALHRLVAVKVMHAPLNAGLGDRDTIRREARAAARIEHPDAMGVYDVGETITSGGRLTAYVVMRLLDGHSLADILDDGPLGWRDTTEIVYRVANVLAAAHGRGIVHRDVTPENVMLTDDGAKLLDFGIAAEVGHRDDEACSPVFGTPPYVAPERLRGAEAAGATDVYALGVLMFQMLTGHFPYPEVTWDELETARRSGRPPRPTGVPGMPRRITRLCRRCLAADPADRPTAAEVAQDLAAVLGHEGHWARRNTGRVGAVLVGVLILGTTAVILTGPPLEISDQQSARATPSASATRSVATATSAPPTASPSPTRSSLPQTHGLATSTISVAQATAAAHAVLNRGLAAGSIRPDVVSDLGQQIDNLVANPATAKAERQRRLDDLHRNIRNRTSQAGAITLTYANDLDAAVVVIGTAIENTFSPGPAAS